MPVMPRIRDLQPEVFGALRQINKDKKAWYRGENQASLNRGGSNLFKTSFHDYSHSAPVSVGKLTGKPLSPISLSNEGEAGARYLEDAVLQGLPNSIPKSRRVGDLGDTMQGYESNPHIQKAYQSLHDLGHYSVQKKNALAPGAYPESKVMLNKFSYMNNEIVEFGYIPRIEYPNARSVVRGWGRAAKLETTPVSSLRPNAPRLQQKRYDTAEKAQRMYMNALDTRDVQGGIVYRNTKMPLEANAELEAIPGIHTGHLGYSTGADNAISYQAHRRMYDYKPDEVPIRLNTKRLSDSAARATNQGFPNRPLPRYPSPMQVADNKRLTQIGIPGHVEHPDYPLKRDAFGKPVEDSGFYIHEGKWGEVPISQTDPKLTASNRNVEYL